MPEAAQKTDAFALGDFIENQRSPHILGGALGAGLANLFPIELQRTRIDAAGFELSGDQSHGLMTHRSHGDEDDNVDLVPDPGTEGDTILNSVTFG